MAELLPCFLKKCCARTSVGCSCALDLSVLEVSSVDVTGIGFCFSEQEIWSVVRAMPPDKAPGPDMFTGLFYQMAWPVIKNDIMHALHAFWQLDF
jgi:hypothetical protein